MCTSLEKGNLDKVLTEDRGMGSRLESLASPDSSPSIDIVFKSCPSLVKFCTVPLTSGGESVRSILYYRVQFRRKPIKLWPYNISFITNTILKIFVALSSFSIPISSRARHSYKYLGFSLLASSK